MISTEERWLQSEPWMQDALCTQVDPETFFPDKGFPNQAAKTICALCPVRTPCLQYALHHDERYGIWGGLSERQRAKLRRPLRSA